jgi:hypothetical protein
MTVSSEPHFVDTTLRYFTPPADGSKAWTNLNIDPTTGEPTSNWEHEPHAVKVENLRGRTDGTLDKNGFQFFHHPPKHTSFATDEEIEREYYPESIELLKQLTGASRVVLFDHSECLSPKHARKTNNVILRDSHPPPAPWSREQHAPASGASLERTRRPDNRIGRRARATPSPIRRRRGTTTAALPDRQSLAADPPHCARLATCALRLQQRRP